MSVVYLGVDPGATGAIALIDGDGKCLDLDDMPMVDGLVDWLPYLERLRWAKQFGDVRAALERQWARQTDGISGAFKYGHNYGVLRSGLQAEGVRFETPTPQAWKAKVGVSADKESSRRAAQELFPDMAQQLKFKKDHGRAEALLLAEYLRRLEGRRRGKD